MLNEQASRPRWQTLALGAALAFGCAGAAAAQEIPEGQSCGGLVCDLGLFGHKVPPKAPAATAPAALPSTAAESRPAVPRAEATRSAERRAPRRKPREAKAAPTQRKATPPVAGTVTTARTAAAPKVSLAMPLSAIPIPGNGAAVPLTIASEPPPPAPVVAPPPAPEPPVVMANPYVYTRPLPFMFQSVDPTQGVQ